ncbi:MAG: rRNA maturation RNase YbeY [Armatimonadetes bacterium]|nr:rRNA maturation RNase YbeY [Armatimonadota bacterium]
MRKGLEALLDLYSVPSSRIDVLVTTDEAMRALNREYRGQDEATDVLTFPGPDWDGAPLGDIAVSLPFARRGAAARRATLGAELACLGIHGGLHLLGFDDATEAGRADMVRRMNEVLAKMGLPTDESWASQEHLAEGRS